MMVPTPSGPTSALAPRTWTVDSAAVIVSIVSGVASSQVNNTSLTTSPPTQPEPLRLERM